MAKVRLCGLPGNKASKGIGICTMARSDHEGRFVFSNVAAARYYLAGEAAGYLEEYLIQNGRGEYDFALYPGEARKFRLVLWPESSVTGRVLSNSGKPLAGVAVSAIRDEAVNGRRAISHYQYWGGPSEVQTNKDGEFRIGGVLPGRYYIEAAIPMLSKQENSLLHMGLIPAYYPDSTALNTATLLCVGAGEERNVEFSLTPRPTRVVRGKLEMTPGFNRSFEPLWGLRRDDGNFYGHCTKEEFDHRTGAFEIRGVPPGSYSLEVQTGINETDLVAKKSFVVADANVNGLDFRLEKRFTLRANVQIPLGFRPSTPFSVLFNLELDGTAKMIEAGQPMTNGSEVTFNHLQSGHYKLYLFTDDPVYIKSAKLDEQDVLVHGLSLHGAPAGVFNIALAEASAELSGVVVGEGGVPVGGADVKLVAHGDDSPFVLRSLIADSKGQFILRGVPPGQYDLVALTDARRDWEFGSFEFDQVKQMAIEVQVGEAAVTGLTLRVAILRFPSSVCSEPLVSK
jgi:hypothetical protein